MLNFLAEVFWNEVQRHCYPFTTQAVSDFIVYSCVASSFACVSKAGYLPVAEIASNDLRVAC